ncbi:MAG TPA: group 1 truncated hemoglobin [Nitrospiria bacterium]|nr:group 1 truncated hemoglobin [Nitrospiria bacterium]
MKTHSIKPLVLLGALVVFITACGAAAPKKEATLYERLGGKAAIEAVVNDFIDTVGSDSRITNAVVLNRLAEIDIATLKSHVTHLVCGATGGPCEYHGRDMKTAHNGLRITDEEFDVVVDDLVQTLSNYQVPEREKNELLALLGPMRPDIVEAP